jgi:SAM-dependent methyltransferase
LDIKNTEDARQFGKLDFIISSDVLEHVEAPVTTALQNLRAMLKPGGILILSVPYLEGYETIEHYPHLYDYSIAQVGEKYLVLNMRRDGMLEVFENPVFHGGPGSVLELRIFGEGDLSAMLRYAGFGTIEMAYPDLIDAGYVWDAVSESQLWRGRLAKSYVWICRNDVEDSRGECPDEDID